MTHESFRSEVWRLRQIEACRNGEHRFFRALRPVQDDLLLRAELELPLLSDVHARVLYDRNHHLVLRLTNAAGQRIVWKLYPHKPRRHTEGRANNDEIEVRYLKITQELLQRSVCPHFVLCAAWSLVPRADLATALPHLHLTPCREYVSLLAECCDGDLTTLIHSARLSREALCGLIVQALLTLTILQSIFPSFRHNDAHTSNWLVHELGRHPVGSLVRYRVHDVVYNLDLAHCPYRLLLWDMHYASISEADARGLPLLVPRDQEMFALTDAKNTRTETNQYYDLHCFVDTLEAMLRHAKRKIAVDLQRFFDLIVPAEWKCASRARDPGLTGIHRLHHTTPALALEHEIFNTFRRDMPGRVIREYVFPELAERKQKE
jgi:hypothetical protein